MSEYTEGKLEIGRTDGPDIMIVGGKNRDYICSIRIKQNSGGAIAEAMELRRKANVGELIRRWNCHKGLLEVCKEVHDWLDTSSLQKVLVHNCKDSQTDALIMGIASHLTRLEAVIAEREKEGG